MTVTFWKYSTKVCSFVLNLLGQHLRWYRFLNGEPFDFCFNVSRQFLLVRPGTVKLLAHRPWVWPSFTSRFWNDCTVAICHTTAILFENAAVQVLERKEIVLAIRKGWTQKCFINLVTDERVSGLISKSTLGDYTFVWDKHGKTNVFLSKEYCNWVHWQ